MLPIAKYERLLDLAEDRADAVEAGRVAARIAGKTHPLKLWRQHRAMTLAGLGDACCVTRSAVPKIENGEIRRKLATALRCEMDDLA